MQLTPRRSFFQAKTLAHRCFVLPMQKESPMPKLKARLVIAYKFRGKTLESLTVRRCKKFTSVRARSSYASWKPIGNPTRQEEAGWHHTAKSFGSRSSTKIFPTAPWNIIRRADTNEKSGGASTRAAAFYFVATRRSKECLAQNLHLKYFDKL